MESVKSGRKTSIVNVKVKYICPEYDNLKEWMKDPNNIYIGRAGIVFVDGERFPKKDSKWCNPFKIKEYDREEYIRLYKRHLDKLLQDEDNLEEFVLLEGKTLGCWCKPEDCHGDVIISRLKRLKKSQK